MKELDRELDIIHAEPANLLLNAISTASSGTLPTQANKDLIVRIKSCETTEGLNDLIESICFDFGVQKNDLEHIVKNMELSGRKLKNLRTLVSQIVKNHRETEIHSHRSYKDLESKEEAYGDGPVDDTIQIMRAKNSLINKLLHGSNKDVFFKLLDDAMESKVEIPKDYINEFEVIKRLYKKIEPRKDWSSVYKEVILETYSRFTLGAGSCVFDDLSNFTKSKLLESISSIEEHTKSIAGKDIVIFLGNTGSGKSTSIGYLQGLPLETYINDLGEESVRIIKKECKLISIKDSPQIGHALGTSETLYSRAYEIEGCSDMKYNTLLCDTPGFNDTRGPLCNMIAAMSIDAAIHACNKVRSLVLVLPYQVFNLDKVNHLVKIFNSILNVFPDILNAESEFRKSFYVAITKCSSNSQKNSYRERLIKHMCEEGKRINELKKSDTEVGGFLEIEKKIEIFKFLLSNYDQGRSDFLDVNDSYERVTLIEKYLGKKFNLEKGVSNSFVGSLCANQLNDIVKLSKNLLDKIILPAYGGMKSENNKLKIEQQDLQSTLKSNQCKFNSITAEAFKLKNTQELGSFPMDQCEEGSRQELIAVQACEASAIEKIELEESYVSKQFIIAQERYKVLKESFEKQIITIIDCDNQINRIEQTLRTLKKGTTKIPIYNMSLRRLEFFKYNPNTKRSDIEYAMKNFLEIPSPDNESLFISQNCDSTVDLVKVLKFPHSVLTDEKAVGNSSPGIHPYKWDIILRSPSFSLKNINNRDCGKTLAIHININFNNFVFNKEYIEIAYNIRNEIVNRDAINENLAKLKYWNEEILIRRATVKQERASLNSLEKEKDKFSKTLIDLASKKSRLQKTEEDRIQLVAYADRLSGLRKESNTIKEKINCYEEKIKDNNLINKRLLLSIQESPVSDYIYSVMSFARFYVKFYAEPNSLEIFRIYLDHYSKTSVEENIKRKKVILESFSIQEVQNNTKRATKEIQKNIKVEGDRQCCCTCSLI